MHNKEELNRYNRQLILSEIGLIGQEKLKKASVLIIGAGGLGCPILQYLVAAGVGEIGIADNDVVDLSNLQRQILFSVNDIGQKKALVASNRLNQINPLIKINPIAERLTSLNAQQIIEKYSIIVDASDNFETRYVINDTCVLLNKPWIFGSIYKFEGQVSLFNFQNGPTYRCLYPNQPNHEDIQNCSELGVLGVVPGIVGLYMANEVLKLIIGIGKLLSGKLLIINTLENSVNSFNFKRTNYKLHSIKSDVQHPSADLGHSYNEIELNQLLEWLELETDDIYLIDVREPNEFELSNLGGINIPLWDLEAAIHTIPLNKKIVVCCLSGQRSKIAIDIIKRHIKNSNNIFHVKNGIVQNNF